MSFGIIFFKVLGTEPDKILIGAKIEKTLEGFHVSVFGSENLEKDYPKTHFTIKYFIV
jgi:hypothetical protein